MPIRKNTNPCPLDLSPGLQDILLRNGLQAHVTATGDTLQLVVQGHDSPVLAYTITQRQLTTLTDWGTNHANKQAYDTLTDLIKNDFDMPKNLVHARNANGRVTMGLHGYRIGAGENGRIARQPIGWHTDMPHVPFLGWTPRQQEGYHLRRIGGDLFYRGAPIVPDRPDARIKPGELVSGGYGFYYKGQQAQTPTPQKDVLADLQANIQPIAAAERTTKAAIPYKQAITSDVYFSDEKWQQVLATHGLVIDTQNKTLTVQSAAAPADLQYDLTDAELRKLTSNTLKDVPLKDRLATINNVIGKDFKDAVTMDMLNAKQSLNIQLTDTAKAEISQQLAATARQASLTANGTDIIPMEQADLGNTPRPTLDENAVDGRDIQEGKGWFREGPHGRPVEVTDIRVERITPSQPTATEAKGQENTPKPTEAEAKYRMTAVINGQSVTHDITQKQYDKFMALDDEHRMKLFAKIFPEVDIKKVPKERDPDGLNFGQKLMAGLTAALGVAHEAGHLYNEVHAPRPEVYASHVEHHPVPERVFFKPGVDTPMDVAARAYEAQANAEQRHIDMHQGM